MAYNTDDKLGPVFIYLDPSSRNKLLIYKTLLKPVWSYGGTASTSNIEILKLFQSKSLAHDSGRTIGKGSK
jgi:hypothetical protein